MLPVVWLVVAVLVAIVFTMWATFTLTRLDRLHARVDAAQAALEAQLVRRAAALQHVAESPDSGLPDAERGRFDGIAREALTLGSATPERETVENAVGRAVTDLAERPESLRPDAVEELREAAARVLIARRFYNDAVRDTKALRARRMPRLFRMAGRRDLPQFFDIDDTLPAPARAIPDDTKEEDPR
ncbi:MAG: hypothetical protein ABI345_12955 [Jatrophihabitans sp.]